MTVPPQITLSVVDQSPIRKGGTPSEALWESVRLAQHTENVGYSRYWVAEHHNSSSFAGTSPEILIGQRRQCWSRDGSTRGTFAKCFARLEGRTCGWSPDNKSY
jgi:hypothetical protein